MTTIITSPFFWVACTVLAYLVGSAINQKYKKAIFSPLILGTAMIIILLVVTGTSVSFFNEQVAPITFFLTPITVVLAIPIYRQFDILKRNFFPIIMGSLAGSITSIVTVNFFCDLFGLPEIVLNSLIAKSVTTPIAVEITSNLGGLISITMFALTVAGMTGATMLPAILKAIGIKNDISVGVSIGTASHAVGTSRAITINETVGAMSGLSIGITGIITSIIVSIIY